MPEVETTLYNGLTGITMPCHLMRKPNFNFNTMETTIKFYQTNKAGIETFAVTINGTGNLSELLANALATLGEKQLKWKEKGIRFTGFALSKPCFFYANGKSFDAKVSASLKAKLRFKSEFTVSDYRELIDDLLQVIEL